MILDAAETQAKLDLIIEQYRQGLINEKEKLKAMIAVVNDAEEAFELASKDIYSGEFDSDFEAAKVRLRDIERFEKFTKGLIFHL